jgi:hypothetical protein
LVLRTRQVLKEWVLVAAEEEQVTARTLQQKQA